jgi:hypothetical protein
VVHVHCVLLVDPEVAVELLGGQSRQAAARLPLTSRGPYVFAGQGAQVALDVCVTLSE